MWESRGVRLELLGLELAIQILFSGERTRFLPLCLLARSSHAAHGWRGAQGSVLCGTLALGGRKDTSRRRCGISSRVSVCSLRLRLRLAVRAFIFVVVHAV